MAKIKHKADVLCSIQIVGKPNTYRLVTKAELAAGTRYSLVVFEGDPARAANNSKLAETPVETSFTLQEVMDTATLALSNDPMIREDKQAGRKMAAALIALLVSANKES